MNLINLSGVIDGLLYRNDTEMTGPVFTEPISTTVSSMISSVIENHATNNDSVRGIIWRFSNAYRPIHAWLSTAVCLFGIPSNLLNIIVLTRSNMITSPTNLILTGLAFSDLFTMLSSLLHTVYFYIINGKYPQMPPVPERDTYFWANFSNIHIMLTVTFHSISIYLTVYLACFRYIYIASSSSAACGVPSNTNGKVSNQTNQQQQQGANKSPKNNEKLSALVYSFQRCLLQCRTYNFTLVGILNVCVFCVLFCLPVYIYPQVREKKIFYLNETSKAYYNETELAHLESLNVSFIHWSCGSAYPQQSDYSNKTIIPYKLAYHVDEGDLNKKYKNLIFDILFYTQAILGKFLPCLLLVTFSSLLIHSLVIINRNNKKLNKGTAYVKKKSSSTATSSQEGTNKSSKLLKPIRNVKNNILSVFPSNLKKKNMTLSEGYSDLDGNVKQNSNNIIESKRLSSASVIIRVDANPEAGNQTNQLSVNRTIDEPNQNYLNVVTYKIPIIEDDGKGETPGAGEANSSEMPRSASSMFVRRLSELKPYKLSNLMKGKRNSSSYYDDDDQSNVINNTKKNSKPGGNEGSSGQKQKKPKPKRSKTKENLRTTLMLTVVSVLFLITELPQSILLIFSILANKSFYENVYIPLGDLMDMFALVNNSINFLLYCSMSRAFRNTFYTLVINMWCCKIFKNSCQQENSKFNCSRKKSNLNSNNFSIFTANTVAYAYNMAVNKEKLVNLNKANSNDDLKESTNLKNGAVLSTASSTQKIKKINLNTEDDDLKKSSSIELKPLIKELLPATNLQADDEIFEN